MIITLCIFSADITVGLNYSPNYSETPKQIHENLGPAVETTSVKKILCCLCQGEIIPHEQVLGIFTAVAWILWIKQGYEILILLILSNKKVWLKSEGENLYNLPLSVAFNKLVAYNNFIQWKTLS